jgi:hypothetical protein
MLCDVISAVAEYMVSVLQLPRSIGIHDVARVEAWACRWPDSMLLACHCAYHRHRKQILLACHCSNHRHRKQILLACH